MNENDDDDDDDTNNDDESGSAVVGLGVLQGSSCFLQYKRSARSASNPTGRRT